MSGPATLSGPAGAKGGSLRFAIPNATTFLSFACGLLAIRFAIEGSVHQAVMSVLLAICLDGLDGRLARGLKATSAFGAELDSLADCVAFGVAPAVILYFAALHSLGDAGWVVTTCFAGGIAFRLARFNVEAARSPKEKSDFFVGVPAPAGAAMALLPITGEFVSGVPVGPAMIAIYLAVVTALCVSRLPIYSGKASLSPTLRNATLPGLLILVALFAFPWTSVTVLTSLFVLSIPFGHFYLERQRGAASAAQVE